MSDTITIERPNGDVEITAEEYFSNTLEKLRPQLIEHIDTAKSAVIEALYDPTRPNDGGMFFLEKSDAPAVEQLTDHVHGPQGALEQPHPLQSVFRLADIPVENRPEDPFRQQQLVTHLRKHIIRRAVEQLKQDHELDLISVGNRLIWQPSASANGTYLPRVNTKEPCRRR